MLSIPAEGTAYSSAAGVTSRGVAEPTAVALDRVTKRFGELTAIDQISLAVRRGELMTLLGPSGCGKTTLLNLVAGLLLPESGEIVIDGRQVTNIPTYRRETGIMFQSYALFPHMNVAENVGYGLRMRRLPKPEIARRVTDALALVKLEGVNDRKPRQLSGGQQQRVALARALIIRPKVLLLDEPFSALDRNLRAAMQVELKDIQRKLGVTTIFVTHDQGEALSLSDRIAVIAEGRIRQLGAPGEIYRRPADRFVASFIGDVNVLSARIERNDGATATVAVGGARVLVPAGPLKAVEPGGTVDLFLRPEDLRVAREGEAIAVDGNVAAQIYQGGHIDLYVEVPQAASGRVLLRLTAHEGSSVPPPGTRIGIAIISVEAVAFPQMTGGGRTPGT
jgi:putative spermidine/putrescine transport system ATP-binding protein/spermidine/putrescine transport system ATP-binding protein